MILGGKGLGVQRWRQVHRWMILLSKVGGKSQTKVLCLPKGTPTLTGTCKEETLPELVGCRASARPHGRMGGILQKGSVQPSQGGGRYSGGCGRRLVVAGRSGRTDWKEGRGLNAGDLYSLGPAEIFCKEPDGKILVPVRCMVTADLLCHGRS